MWNKIKGIFSWMWRHKWWSLAIIAVIVLGFIFWGGAKKSGARGAFVTIDISRGDLEQVVSATGEISPVNTVNVGSQVSGTIEEIFVDYNSKVKQGDIL